MKNDKVSNRCKEKESREGVVKMLLADRRIRTLKDAGLRMQPDRYLFVCLVGWLVSSRHRQQLGYITDGSQANITCCHTRDRARRP